MPSRGNYTLFEHNNYVNLVKARIPSGYCVGNLSLLEICLATIGVCVFRCVASVTHFFICKFATFGIAVWRCYGE